MQLTKKTFGFYVNRWFSLSYYSIKCIGWLPLLGVVVCAAILPIFFDLRLVDYREMAQIGELYLSLAGIRLLPHLTLVEQAEFLSETVYPKRTPHWRMVLLRIVIAVVLLFILIYAVLLFALARSGEFPSGELMVGIGVTALLMGMVGLTITTLSGNISAAYITVFLYYSMELLTKGKYTGSLYLFSLMHGRLESGKWVLGAIAMVFFVINIVWIHRKSG